MNKLRIPFRVPVHPLVPVRPRSRASAFPCVRFPVRPISRAAVLSCVRVPLHPRSGASAFPCIRVPMHPRSPLNGAAERSRGSELRNGASLRSLAIEPRFGAAGWSRAQEHCTEARSEPYTERNTEPHTALPRNKERNKEHDENSARIQTLLEFSLSSRRSSYAARERQG